ncbi:MAG: hypothetical protein ACKO2G_10260 [Verrucomicrobiales bacterium]
MNKALLSAATVALAIQSPILADEAVDPPTIELVVAVEEPRIHIDPPVEEVVVPVDFDLPPPDETPITPDCIFPVPDVVGGEDNPEVEAVIEVTIADEFGSEESITDESGSEESITDESGSEESITDESGSEESITDESGSEESITDEVDWSACDGGELVVNEDVTGEVDLGNVKVENGEFDPRVVYMTSRSHGGPVPSTGVSEVQRNFADGTSSVVRLKLDGTNQGSQDGLAKTKPDLGVDSEALKALRMTQSLAKTQGFSIQNQLSSPAGATTAQKMGEQIFLD